MNDCLFCKIVEGEVDCEKIAETENFTAFLDIQPINRGHTLIVPKEHSKTLMEFQEKLGSEFFKITKDVMKALKKSMGADGINLGQNNGEVAGQEIEHTHFHVIPRYKRDGLESWPNKEPEEPLEKTASDIKKHL